MADAVPAFQSAARRLGGDLDVASMDIRGSRHEIPFALEVQWDDDGHAHTLLEVRPALPIDARWHQSWNGGSLAPLPEGLEPLLVGARSVQVDAEAIRAVDRLPRRRKTNPSYLHQGYSQRVCDGKTSPVRLPSWIPVAEPVVRGCGFTVAPATAPFSPHHTTPHQVMLLKT